MFCAIVTRNLSPYSQAVLWRIHKLDVPKLGASVVEVSDFTKRSSSSLSHELKVCAILVTVFTDSLTEQKMFFLRFILSLILMICIYICMSVSIFMYICIMYVCMYVRSGTLSRYFNYVCDKLSVCIASTWRQVRASMKVTGPYKSKLTSHKQTQTQTHFLTHQSAASVQTFWVHDTDLIGYTLWEEGWLCQLVVILTLLAYTHALYRVALAFALAQASSLLLFFHRGLSPSCWKYIWRVTTILCHTRHNYLCMYASATQSLVFFVSQNLCMQARHLPSKRRLHHVSGNA